MNPRGIDFTGVAYIGALLIGAFVVYRVVKAGGDVAGGVRDAVGGAVDAVGNVAASVGNAINPTNPDNIFNRFIGQPIADRLIKGGNPDNRNDGGATLRRFTVADQDDADMGAAMRALQRRPDFIMTPADIEDADQGFFMSSAAGQAFYGGDKLRRGVFK